MFDDPRSEKSLTDDLDEATGFVLAERSFSLCKLLCRHFWIGRTTILRILHDNLGLKRFHLCWVSHALSPNQQSERMLCSKLLFTALMECEPTDFE
jgi:hypothetical protein